MTKDGIALGEVRFIHQYLEALATPLLSHMITITSILITGLIERVWSGRNVVTLGTGADPMNFFPIGRKGSSEVTWYTNDVRILFCKLGLGMGRKDGYDLENFEPLLNR